MYNFEVAPWLRPLIWRVAPEGCQVWIRYRQGARVAVNWLLARWNENPEPIEYAQAALDIRTMVRNRRLDRMYPTDRSGEFSVPYEVAFLVKQEGVNEVWHFNDEAYRFQPAWRNPDWVLAAGTYEIDVRIAGYGLIRPAVRSLRLVNAGPRIGDVRLEPSGGDA